MSFVSNQLYSDTNPCFSFSLISFIMFLSSYCSTCLVDASESSNGILSVIIDTLGVFLFFFNNSCPICCAMNTELSTSLNISLVSPAFAKWQTYGFCFYFQYISDTTFIFLLCNRINSPPIAFSPDLYDTSPIPITSIFSFSPRYGNLTGFSSSFIFFIILLISQRSLSIAFILYFNIFRAIINISGLQCSHNQFRYILHSNLVSAPSILPFSDFIYFL